MDGVVALARNGGRIELIASPQLNEDDIRAISEGYHQREEIIKNAFSRDFISGIEHFDDVRLEVLSQLIAQGTLDIKIAVTDSIGIYHDKLGILEDFSGDVVVFFGSPNATGSGYQNNYEKIRTVKSWVQSDEESIEDEKREFQSLWDGSNPFVKVYEFRESAHTNILKVIERRKSGNSSAGKAPIKLRDYQEEAIKAWINVNEFLIVPNAVSCDYCNKTRPIPL